MSKFYILIEIVSCFTLNFSMIKFSSRKISREFRLPFAHFLRHWISTTGKQRARTISFYSVCNETEDKISQRHMITLEGGSLAEAESLKKKRQRRAREWSHNREEKMYDSTDVELRPKKWNQKLINKCQSPLAWIVSSWSFVRRVVSRAREKFHCSSSTDKIKENTYAPANRK